MNKLVETFPGTLLSTDEVSTDRSVHAISIEIMPLQHAEILENFANSFGAGWFDADNKQLRLQFQLVAIFSNAKIEELWLSVSDKDTKIDLHTACVSSPGVAQKYPQLSWSSQSRFVVNEVIDLPDWAISAPKFELWVSVAGIPEKVGVIHIAAALKSSDTQGSLPEAPVSTAPLASGSIQKTEPMKNNISLLALGAVEHIKGMNRLFLLTVAIPTLLSIIYFGLIASDVYISESRFVVRSPERQTSSGLGALLQGTGFSRSQDDTYTVHDYIFSRDALKQLDDQLAVGKSFSSSKVDIFSRFSGLYWDKSFEALYLYYQKHVVTVDMDTSSSISTLSVSAYTAEGAYQINEKLLEMSENLVNQLNERGRQDMISFAAAVVATAEQKAKAATLAVSNFRNQKGIFDPEKQSVLQLQQVSKLQDELIATKIQLAQIRALTRDNPQIPALQKSIQTLQAEIDTETAKVAGGDRSLSYKTAEYERLVLERDFAGKQLATALASLEQAYNEAQRKQLYLERIVQPGTPDFPMEPRRIRNVFATFVLGLIAWGILTMLLAGVREHQD